MTRFGTVEYAVEHEGVEAFGIARHLLFGAMEAVTEQLDDDRRPCEPSPSCPVDGPVRRKAWRRA